MYFVNARIAKRSICYLPDNKQDLLEDKLSVSCCRVAHSLKTTTTLVIMTFIYSVGLWCHKMICCGLGWAIILYYFSVMMRLNSSSWLYEHNMLWFLRKIDQFESPVSRTWDFRYIDKWIILNMMILMSTSPCPHLFSTVSNSYISNWNFKEEIHNFLFFNLYRTE